MTKPPSDLPRRPPAVFAYEDEAAGPRDNGRQPRGSRKPESFSEEIVLRPTKRIPSSMLTGI